MNDEYDLRDVLLGGLVYIAIITLAILNLP